MPIATILVVDDTPEVLELTSSVLEGAGYAVLRCGGSQQALAILKDGHAVDLLLTDIMMPGEVDGFALAREARATRPSLPIAYITGHAGILPNGTKELLGPILRKPYRRDDLTEQIQELLQDGEDARLLRVVALEMMHRHADALERATEAAELDCAKGDKLSAQAWRDITETIVALST
jgi:CheY-like chemotaxis protein